MPEKEIWGKNCCKLTFLVIFQPFSSICSIPFQTIAKILQANVIRTTTKYLPAKSFIELANRNDRIFLTVDCSGVNINAPGRFRTKSENPNKQVWYFSSQNDNQLFNVLINKQINEKSSTGGIYFQIERVRSKTNTDTCDAKVELNSLLQNGSCSDVTLTKYGDGFGPGYNMFRDGRNINQSEKKQRRSVRPKFLSEQ